MAAGDIACVCRVGFLIAVTWLLTTFAKSGNLYLTSVYHRHNLLNFFRDNDLDLFSTVRVTGSPEYSCALVLYIEFIGR